MRLEAVERLAKGALLLGGQRGEPAHQGAYTPLLAERCDTDTLDCRKILCRADLRDDREDGNKADARKDARELKADQRDVRKDQRDVRTDRRDVTRDHKDVKKDAPQAICQVVTANVARNLIVNRDAPPFDNPDLRWAMSLSLDRRAFIDILARDKATSGGSSSRRRAGSGACRTIS